MVARCRLKGFRMKLCVRNLLLFVFAIFVSGACFAETGEGEFDYSDYRKVLRDNVDELGRVNYRKLKALHHDLDHFLESISELQYEVYEKWNDDEKIAFWINCYNAITLKAVIDHYPIKSSWLTVFRYRKKSVRHITGMWNKLKFPVLGKDMTLDNIEHDVLRKNFKEARIHMSLVCAARGCPQLRNEPYTGIMLDSQLNDQSDKFVNNWWKVQVIPDKKLVRLSAIFKWNSNDFLDKYRLASTANTDLGHFKQDRIAVLNFISQYLNKAEAEYILSGKYRVEFIMYDWTINEKPVMSR